MRMEERGLSQGAMIAIIVGIVVAVVVPVTIVAVLLIGGGGGPGGLPTYGTLIKTNTAGNSTVSYYDIGSLDGSTVYSGEKSQMQAQGWTVTEYAAYTAGAGGILTATKGSDSAYVVVAEGATATSIGQQIGASASKILAISLTTGTTSGGG